MSTLPITKKLRSIWISDAHLGTKDCRADYLLHFLNSVDADNLYLVGDILDLEKITSSPLYWPDDQHKVVKTIFAKAQNGTNTVYIPGNHDSPFRDYVGHNFNKISIEKEYIHTTADNRRFLVSHGDEFDILLKPGYLSHLVGHHGYNLLMALSRVLQRLRGRFGYHDYWSLTAYIKQNIKKARLYIEKFEKAALQEAKRRRLDGYICGHIHRPGIRHSHGVTYCNTGDWVENCSALVEHTDGQMEVLYWAGVMSRLLVAAKTQTTRAA